jgi:hypothetical protein
MLARYWLIGAEMYYFGAVPALNSVIILAYHVHVSQQRDSILGGMAGIQAPKRGRKSGPNMRSSIGSGLVFETLEEELKFGEADHNRAQLQLDLLRACIRLRCTCIPYIGNEIKVVFAVPEEEGPNSKATAAAALQHTAEKAANEAAKAKAAQHTVHGGHNLLSRTKSSLMTKLFTATADKDSDPPSVTLPAGESPARRGNKEKKKLTLLSILLHYVKTASVDLFENNLREVVSIEDQAASTYVNIKTKEIRTTVFAGFSLSVHTEVNSAWKPVGASTKIPVHLARVLLSLGNEKRLLAEALGDLKVLRGDAVKEEEEPASAVVTPPVPGANTPGRANRGLFSPTQDSGSESDVEAEASAKNSAKREFCESLLYRDLLYRQLCLGLLQVYQDLITRLRNNTFSSSEASRKSHEMHRHHDRLQRDMFAGGDASSDEDQDGDSSEGEGDGLSKVPFSLGQAIEEHKYLKVSY